MDGISALIKEAQESSPAPPAMWSYNEQTTLEGPHQTPNLPGAMILDFSSSRSVINKGLLFVSHPVDGIFLTAARMD